MKLTFGERTNQRKRHFGVRDSHFLGGCDVMILLPRVLLPLEIWGVESH